MDWEVHTYIEVNSHVNHMTTTPRLSELDRIQKLQTNPERSQFSLLNPNSPPSLNQNRQDGCCVESRWFDVRSIPIPILRVLLTPPASSIANVLFSLSYSYNRYLAVAARAIRRSLKEGPRLQAERRGQMDLRFSKWEVRYYPYLIPHFPP